MCVFLFSGINTLYSQTLITLKECYYKASEVNALSGEKAAYSEMWHLKDRILSKSWLPTLDATGSFIYNSSVIDIGSSLGDLPVPGIADAIKAMPHEQYKITIDINQTIYDGGAIKNARALEKAGRDINLKQTETDLYKLRSQINTYYFSLLLLERKKELLENYTDLISKRIISMESALKNGVITRSDIDILTSEKIKITQQLNENSILKGSLLNILADLTGMEINNSTVLSLPSVPAEMNAELSRPELELFDLRKDQLAAGLSATESRRLPKAFGFATIGYGNPPGNNFLKDEFASYFILGASVRWNIFDWNKTKNEKQQIILQQNIIENRKTDMTDNLRRLLEAKYAEISNLQSMLESDSVLIDLKKRITASAESQYENGTITASDLLNEMNAEKEAMISMEIHRINLAMAKIEYLNIGGWDIEYPKQLQSP